MPVSFTYLFRDAEQLATRGQYGRADARFIQAATSTSDQTKRLTALVRAYGMRKLISKETHRVYADIKALQEEMSQGSLNKRAAYKIIADAYSQSALWFWTLFRELPKGELRTNAIDLMESSWFLAARTYYGMAGCSREEALVQANLRQFHQEVMEK